MSDKSVKGRPIAERIGQLGGRSAYRDPRDGHGGIPSLTDQDIAAALGIARSALRASKDGCEVASEILETHYGGTLRHRSVLRAAYLRGNTPDKAGGHSAIVVRRMAASLGVHMLAGMEYGRSQEQEYAYICHIRVETLRDEIARAYRWYLDRLDEAFRAFMAACSTAHEERVAIERRERTQRVERLKADIEAERLSQQQCATWISSAA